MVPDGGYPLPMTRHSRPFAPLVAPRFDHRAFGAADLLKNFTLTKLTSWTDGVWVEGRGVAAAFINYYFWTRGGLVNVPDVRRRYSIA